MGSALRAAGRHERGRAVAEDHPRRPNRADLVGELLGADDEHRAEVAIASEKTFRSQILLDAIVEAEEVKVSQDELTQYLVQGAAQYNMEPGEFIKVLDENGQIPGMIGEVARGKALATVLSKAEVVDSNGKPVDLSAFTAPVTRDGEDFVEASAGTGTDSHGRSVGDEHFGHDHN